MRNRSSYGTILLNFNKGEIIWDYPYKKLWKLLIDRNMKKSNLGKLTNLSQSTIAKLAKDENVNTAILERICKSLKCNISDIVEFETIEEVAYE